MHRTPTPTADSATATISVSAGTFLVGGQSITYAAASGTVSVSPGVTKTFYLYYDDPRMQGGSLPLGITDDRIVSMAGNYRIAISSVRFTPPNPGDPPVTGGGGIGGSGGGGTLTVNPTVNGTIITGVSAVLNADVTNNNVQMYPVRSVVIGGKNRRIGAVVTTDGSWTPVTADISVTVFVLPRG